MFIFHDFVLKFLLHVSICCYIFLSFQEKTLVEMGVIEKFMKMNFLNRIELKIGSFFGYIRF